MLPRDESHLGDYDNLASGTAAGYYNNMKTGVPAGYYSPSKRTTPRSTGLTPIIPKEEQLETAAQLTKAQRAAKNAGTGMQAAGTGVQAAGKGTELAGKGVEMAGKGISAAGKGIQAGGQAMASAGAALTGTGIGAIAGIPLAITGGATALAGGGVQLAGGGVQLAGKGTRTAGKGIVATGKGIKKAGQQTKRLAQGSRLKLPGGMMPGGKQIGIGSRMGGINLNQKGQQNAISQLTKAHLQSLKNLKEKAGQAKELIQESPKMITKELLKQSWLNAIPSLGLTLLYINFHFIVAYLGGMTKLFCRFGHEWTPKTGLQPPTSNQSTLTKITEGTIAKSVEIFEIALLLIVDVIIILLLVAIFIIIYFTLNPTKLIT